MTMSLWIFTFDLKKKCKKVWQIFYHMIPYFLRKESLCAVFLLCAIRFVFSPESIALLACPDVTTITL